MQNIHKVNMKLPLRCVPDNTALHWWSYFIDIKS